MSASKEKLPIRVSYAICFWLFMIANLAGVLIEGIFYVIVYGEWEAHVVTVWGPFCLLYGFGTVGFYLMAAALQGKGIVPELIGYALVGDGLELIGGLLLEFGLGMRAWNYTNHFLNFRGHISLQMTVVWALVGFAFSRFCPLIGKGLSQFEHGIFRILLIVLSVFMLVNMIFTAICIVRWSRRHYGVKASSAFEEFLDERYNDDYMSKRFMEWHFLDEYSSDGVTPASADGGQQDSPGRDIPATKGGGQQDSPGRDIPATKGGGQQDSPGRDIPATKGGGREKSSA